ncbi:MAG: hypothetical protein JSW48_05500 [Betaproteobacteria bacterium]|jgi:hypothetical protein|nr:MAG: hypothetical protein JSW48_05500 [Betaproteobacteria bacterium]
MSQPTAGLSAANRNVMLAALFLIALPLAARIEGPEVKMFHHLFVSSTV